MIFEEIIREATNTRYIVSRFPTALDVSLVLSLSTRIKAPRRTIGVVSIDLATSLAKSWKHGSLIGARFSSTQVDIGTSVSSLISIAPSAHEVRESRNESTDYCKHKCLPW